MLAIRRDLRLLRLPTGAEVRQHVSLRNTGPAQVPGLPVLDVYDIWGDADHQHQRAVVFFNARAAAVDYRLSALPCRDLALDHRHQQSSTDPVVRTASVDGELQLEIPGRTAAVFVATRSAEEQTYLLLGDVEALVASQELSTAICRRCAAAWSTPCDSCALGGPEPAATSLGRFVDRVEVLVARGRLDGEVGARLVGDAQAALAAMD